MATITHPGPVNPAQVIAALEVESCTVRANDDDGTTEVEVDDVDEATLTSALASIAYSAPASPATDAEKIAELVDATSVLTDLVFSLLEG